VAGRYSAPDPCVNTHAAVVMANRLLDLGYIPVVPHLTHFWHTMTPRPYEDWLRIALAMVERCDALYRLAGHSPGADREVARARECGLPVYLDGEAGLASLLHDFPRRP
jgi:hypothetical protein